MKYTTLKAAQLRASIDTTTTGVKHHAVKSQYFSIALWDMVNCYTIII